MSYRTDAIGSDSPRSNNITEIYKGFKELTTPKKVMKKFNVLTNGHPNCVFKGVDGSLSSNATASGLQ